MKGIGKEWSKINAKVEFQVDKGKWMESGEVPLNLARAATATEAAHGGLSVNAKKNTLHRA